MANLQRKTLDDFNTVSKSINESNITENNKTLTESSTNLLLEITTTTKTLLSNSTRERSILDDNNNDINKGVKKRKRLNYQIYRSHQLSNYYENLVNIERPYILGKFWQRVNESTSNDIKELKR